MILVAGDDGNDMNFLQWAFTKADLAVPIRYVHSGTEAMDYLLGTPPFEDRTKYPLPSLLMLDLKMSCVDGFKLLSWLRKLPSLDQLKVVAMSGSSGQKDFERARTLGADFCLSKSLEFSELVAAIKDLVSRHRAHSRGHCHFCFETDSEQQIRQARGN